MRKIPIDEATVPQLRYHAEQVLGIELPRVANAAQIIGKMKAVNPNIADVMVEDAHESPAQAEAEERTADAQAIAAQRKESDAIDFAEIAKDMPARQAAQHHYDPTIEISVSSQPGPGGDRDVPVAVNGVQFAFPRDTWVKVPYRIYEAVRHAVQSQFQPVNDVNGKMLEMSERKVPSYPFSTQNGPSQAEIDAWRERTNAVELA